MCNFLIKKNKAGEISNDGKKIKTYVKNIPLNSMSLVSIIESKIFPVIGSLKYKEYITSSVRREHPMKPIVREYTDFDFINIKIPSNTAKVEKVVLMDVILYTFSFKIKVININEIRNNVFFILYSQNTWSFSKF